MLRNLSEFLTQEDVDHFQRDGFLIINESIFESHTELVLKQYVEHLELVLNGSYDLGISPAKMNKSASSCASGKLPFSFKNANTNLLCSKRSTTIHLINIWQSDSLFRTLVTSPRLGSVVVKLMGWEEVGCRVAQDQVWIKPPHSGPLSYHRDTPYIDFDPKEVCTVWIPFSELSSDCGTLEYCAGSHRWNNERRGSANQFYDSNYKAMLESAAELEKRKNCKETAKSSATLEIHRVLTPPGGCAIHNGNTWHGSDGNHTDGWRCGIGIHFVRGDATLARDMGKLWKDLQGDATDVIPREEVFPRTS